MQNYTLDKIVLVLNEIYIKLAWKPSYAFTFSVKHSKSTVNRSRGFEGYDQTYKPRLPFYI